MDKIKLERITKDYTKLIVKWRNNPKVKRNFVFQETFTESMHNNWMDTKVKNGDVVQFIILIEDNKPIGSVYFRDIDYKTMESEFGIFIGEDNYRGQGYGYQATKEALRYAFDVLHMKKVILRVFDDNTNAVRTYLKSGFSEYGVSKQYVNIDGEDRHLIFMKLEDVDYYSNNSVRRTLA